MNMDDYEIDKRLVRTSFDRAADHYDECAVLQREVGNRLLERLDCIHLQPGCIIDAGAGTGHQSRLLLDKFADATVFSLDLSKRMLQTNRQVSSRQTRQEFICADIEQLPLASHSVDLLFSNLTLQWVQNYDALFDEINRVLKPGGLLLFTSFGPDTLIELRSSWAAVDQQVHVNAFIDMHDIGDAMVRAGLADPVMDVEHIQLTYPDAWQLMRELKQIGAHNMSRGRHHRITGKQRFLAMIAAYEQFRSDGRLPASYEIIYGHAWGTGTNRQQAAADGGVAIPVSAIRRRRRGGPVI